MDLADLLMRQYGLDRETADELAAVGEKIMSGVFQSCNVESMNFDVDEFPPIINSDDVKRTLVKQGFTKAFVRKSRMPFMIKAAGDGNCLLTTLACGLELEEGVKVAQKCLLENRLPSADDGEPAISGEEGGEAWQDGVQIRKRTIAFYGSDRLHRELPSTFGNVFFEVTDSTGAKTTQSRRMTRCDLLCTESQFSNRVDIDMSDSEEALKKREKIAHAYLATISEHGSWCSTPSIVAFAISHLPPKKPVRVYLFDNGQISVYADVMPEGTDPLPPAQQDEFLCDFELAKEEFGAYDNTLDDFEATNFEEGHTPISTPPSHTTDSALQLAVGAGQAEQENGNDEEEEEEEENFNQDFFRIIFRPGHYDLAVTASQRATIVQAWPHLDQLFVPFPETTQVKFPSA